MNDLKFISRVKRHGGSMSIAIPSLVLQVASLQNGDVVEVSIRKVKMEGVNDKDISNWKN